MDEPTEHERRVEVATLTEALAHERTRLAIAEQALRESQARFEDAAQKQVMLAALLSCEIRTPLNALHSALGVLKQAQERPELAERALGVMERQLAHLTRVYDDLMDMGPGISSEKLSRAFHDGWFELALAKGRVELHGGSITAHGDELDERSWIVVRLPVAPTLPRDEPTSASRSDHA
jgi:signal transduction histidine kinase